MVLFLSVNDCGQYAKYFILTDISGFSLCGFDPLLMYMQNKPCSACCCQLLLYLVDQLFSSNLMLVSAQDE